MVWCQACNAEVEVDYNESAAITSCQNCGRVLEDAAFSSDVTFMKGADGEGELVGQFVGERGEVRGLQRMAGGKVWSMRGDSHEVSLSKGRHELMTMIDHFMIRPAQDMLEAAHRLYRLAVQASFTKGRQVNQVAACCLYIICRQEQKAIMLIDLSDMLQVNVYKLGAVYLQLTKVLHVDAHPTLTRPIDPSLYIHRFVQKLDVGDDALGQRIGNTAMRLIGQMKRDWMQTGRRPAGICGAALWMACHMNKVYKTKADVMGVVHVGWATLDKRVREFSYNAVAGMTIKEFDAAAEAAEQEQAELLAALEKASEQHRLTAGPSAHGALVPRRKKRKRPRPEDLNPEIDAWDEPEEDEDVDEGEEEEEEEEEDQLQLTVCEHMAEGAPHAAMRMCAECFKHFLQTTGGIWGEAANPPAFKSAEERAAEKAAALTAGDDEDEPAPIGLLLPAPGHGTDEEILAEMEVEQKRQQELQRQRAGRGAGRGGRGRGRGRARAGKGEIAVLLGGDTSTQAAAAEAGDDAEQIDEVAAQVAELDTALHQLHDAVCHTDEQRQEQPEEQQQDAATAGAATAGDSIQRSASGEFGASLLGYGRAYVHSKGHALPAAKRRKQQEGGDSSAATAAAGPTGIATPSQRPPRRSDEELLNAALVESTTEGLGVELAPAAADIVHGALEVGTAGSAGGTDGLSPGTGAVVAVPGEAEGGQEDAAAAGAPGGDSSSHDSGTDLEAVDDDEIASYLRSEPEIKLHEAVWTSLNKDWLAAQQLKRANQEAADAAAAEVRRVAEENAAAVAGQTAAAAGSVGEEGAAGLAVAEGVLGAGAGTKKPPSKRGPKKPKASRPAALPEAASVHAAARMNVEANKNLSAKINYKVLDDLFDSTRTAVASAGRRTGAGGSAAAAAGLDDSGPSFAAAVAAKQQQRAAETDQEAARYKQQLEAEARRRGGTGFGLGLGGLGGGSGEGSGKRSGGVGGVRAGGNRLGSLRR